MKLEMIVVNACPNQCDNCEYCTHMLIENHECEYLLFTKLKRFAKRTFRIELHKKKTNTE